MRGKAEREGIDITIGLGEKREPRRGGRRRDYWIGGEEGRTDHMYHFLCVTSVCHIKLCILFNILNLNLDV